MFYSRGAVNVKRLLLLLVSILSQTLLTLVRRHLVTLSFFTAWHCVYLI